MAMTETPAPGLPTIDLAVGGMTCQGCVTTVTRGLTRLDGVAEATVNLATKRAAATAIGFTSIFAYASTVLSGWGLGLLVQRQGWDMGLAGLVTVAGVGALLFVLAWPAKPHGYGVAVTDAEPESRLPAGRV